MVLVHETLPYCALHLYEVSLVVNLKSGHEIALQMIKGK